MSVRIRYLLVDVAATFFAPGAEVLPVLAAGARRRRCARKPLQFDEVSRTFEGLLEQQKANKVCPV